MLQKKANLLKKKLSSKSLPGIWNLRQIYSKEWTSHIATFCWAPNPNRSLPCLLLWNNSKIQKRLKTKFCGIKFSNPEAQLRNFKKKNLDNSWLGIWEYQVKLIFSKRKAKFSWFSNILGDLFCYFFFLYRKVQVLILFFFFAFFFFKLEP